MCRLSITVSFFEEIVDNVHGSLNYEKMLLNVIISFLFGQYLINAVT